MRIGIVEAEDGSAGAACATGAARVRAHDAPAAHDRGRGVIGADHADRR